ncbi:MAG TPA: cupin domain-containing protein, partial [Vicinamibacterales bacterium]|nr:cupin domain-containing protein [Vicinamibacterales bacterium]
PPPTRAAARPQPAEPPRTVSIPDFLEENLIAREPRKESMLGCTAGGTARLLQLREPLAEQSHDEVDEVLYVVAGEGTLRVAGREFRLQPGTYSLVPRGHLYSIGVRGSKPLILLSVEAGAPCEERTPG